MSAQTQTELAALTATYEGAVAAQRSAELVKKVTTDALNDAASELAAYQLSVLGVEFLVTRVTVNSGRINRGTFFVDRVSKAGRVVLCKIKKDGSPSCAGTGLGYRPEVSELTVVST